MNIIFEFQITLKLWYIKFNEEQQFKNKEVSMKIKKLLSGGIIALALSLGLISFIVNKKPVGVGASIESDEVFIDGKSFNDIGSNWMKNGGLEGTSGDYNAYYDSTSSTLKLKGFEGHKIFIDSEDDINIVLEEGTNNTIDALYTDGDVYGIKTLGGLIVKGSGSLTINATKTVASDDAYGIKAGDYLTIQETPNITVDMSGVTKGTVKGLSSYKGFTLAGGAILTLNMEAHSEQNTYTYGIYNEQGGMNFTSSGDFTVNFKSDSGMAHYCIYNAAGNSAVSYNGDILFSGAGKVTLNKTGTAYCEGIVSARNDTHNTSGTIRFDGSDVEINNFAYAVINHSNQRSPDDYDIILEGLAKVSIESEYESFPDGLFSVRNGILIDSADYTYIGTGFPVNCAGSGNFGYNESEAGFDVLNESHVYIETSSYIHTYSQATSEIDLTASGSFIYAPMEGKQYRLTNGQYNIKLGNDTRELRISKLRKIVQPGMPDGTFHLGGWSGYEFDYPYEFRAYVKPIPSSISLNDGKVSLTNAKPYFVNNVDDPLALDDLENKDPSNYNAKLDTNEGILYLKGYSGATISMDSDSGALLRVVIEQNSTITATTYGFDFRGSNANLEITTLDGNARTLTIDVSSSSGSYDCRGISIANGSLAIRGWANVVIDSRISDTATGGSIPIDVGFSSGTVGSVLVEDHASVNLRAHSKYEYGNDAAIRCDGKVTFDVFRYVGYTSSFVDASDVAGSSYAIYAGSYLFNKFNEIFMKWHGTSGSYGSIYNANLFTVVTNGSVNVSTELQQARLYYNDNVHHLDVVNGHITSGQWSGNFYYDQSASFTADIIDGINFLRWEKTSDENEIEDPTQSSSTMHVRADDTLTATYDFVERQPMFDTQGDADNKGYIYFELKGTPTKVDVVSATNHETKIIDSVVSNTGYTELQLPNGNYCLRATYGSNQLFTNSFVVNHQAEAHAFTITYHANGGVGTDYVDQGNSSYNLLTAENAGISAVPGKHFVAWAEGSEAGTQRAEGYNFNVYEDYDFYAIYDFNAIGEISFSAGGGSGTMDSINTYHIGESFTLPNCSFVAPAHKQFKCWSIGGVEYAVGASYVIDGDVSILAVYEDIPVEILVEVEGGSGTQVISGIDGGQVVLPSCTLTAPEGKEFDGWIVDGVKYQAGESVTINVGSTIKASWKDIPVETSTTPANAEKKGLSGGAIAGIVIGSVVVAGVGGFALVWFVIKKKSFADLVAVFKKK